MSDKKDIFSGARAALYIGNEEIGYATGCSGGEDIDLVPVVTLNNVQVREFVPVGYSVSFSASRVVLLTKSFKREGIFPKTDKDAATHLDNMLNAGGEEGLTVNIFDKSGELFMSLQKAQMASRSWSFGPRDVVGEDVNFVGVRIYEQADNPQ